MLASYGVSVAVVCVQVFGDTEKVTTGWYHTFLLLLQSQKDKPMKKKRNAKTK